METNCSENPETAEEHAEADATQPESSERTELDATVDRLIELYEALAADISGPGPCPACRDEPSRECPTLATMDAILEFVEDHDPERVSELVE